MDCLKRNVPCIAATLVATLVILSCGLPTTPASPTRETTPVVATTEPTPSPESPIPATPSTTQSPTAPPTAPATVASPPTLTPTPIPTQPPPTSTPLLTLDCAVLPEGVFLTIWQSDATRQAVLGCPTSNHPRTEPAAWEVQTAYQPFEHGAMIWSGHIGWYEKPIIYVLYEDGTFEALDDTFDPDTASEGETPPDGLFEPILGLGKVWREEPGVRTALGWATAEQTSGVGRFQLFAGGNMIWLSQRGETVILLSAGSTYAVEISPAFE